MKYLKLYESFSLDKTDEDIIEICYDITDDDLFTVDICFSTENEINRDIVAFLSIRKHDYTSFDFNIIKETVLRIIDYLGDRFIEFVYRNKYYEYLEIPIDENDDIGIITGVDIEYRYVDI